MPSLLVIDDEPNVLYSIRKSFHSSTLTVLTAQTAAQGLELIQRQRPDAVILDVRLGDMSGLEAFDHIRSIDPQLPVIFITAFATTETAIEATKRGAFEYLLKPVDFHQLHDVVERALELSRLRHVPAVIDGTETLETADRIVGRSPLMQEVYKAIGRVAPLDVTVLICGESGTGKSWSPAACIITAPGWEPRFWRLNCAAIPETLLESELFGHERRASPARNVSASVSLNRRTVGPCSSTRSGTWPPPRRPSCCGSCRNSVSNAWGATIRSRSMCV